MYDPTDNEIIIHEFVGDSFRIPDIFSRYRIPYQVPCTYPMLGTFEIKIVLITFASLSRQKAIIA